MNRKESNEFIEKMFNNATWLGINPCEEKFKTRESKTGREINLEKKIKEKEDARKYLNEEFKASVHAWKNMLNEQKKETAKVKEQLREVESVWQTRMQNMEDNAVKRIEVLNRDKERLYRELEYAGAGMTDLADKLKAESNRSEAMKKECKRKIELITDIVSQQKETIIWHISQRGDYLRENEKIAKECDRLELEVELEASKQIEAFEKRRSDRWKREYELLHNRNIII